jgi:pSer/pThr/pTyr-binding forkhead associated (FHA) protein
MSVCSNCGKENQVHYKYCLGCGAELSGDPPPPKADVAAPESKVEPKPEPRAIPRTVMAEPAPEPRDTSPGDDGMLGAIASALAKSDAGTNPAWRPSGEPEAAAGGFANVPELEPTPVMSPPAVTPAAPSSTRACPTCGSPVPNDFSFCGQCGARLEPKAAEPAPRPAFTTAPPAATTSAGPRGRLVLVRPDGSEGGSHPLEEGENPIGRGFGTLFDADGYLSPRHAELVLNAAGLVVRDTGSLNGVFVRLTGEEEIFDGDIFRIGQELLRFDEIRAPEPLDDGTEVLGSPNPGYWGRLAVIVGREQDGSAFPLFGDAVVLGRERGDLTFPEDGYVSGTHARVAFRDDRYYLCDMNSSNGTFLRIHGERVVQSGSFVLMGQQLFRVQYQ